MNDDNALLKVGIRVVAGLVGVAVGAIAVRWATQVFHDSCSWIAEEVRTAMKKEIE